MWPASSLDLGCEQPPPTAGIPRPASDWQPSLIANIQPDSLPVRSQWLSVLCRRHWHPRVSSQASRINKEIRNSNEGAFYNDSVTRMCLHGLLARLSCSRSAPLHLSYTHYMPGSELQLTAVCWTSGNLKTRSRFSAIAARLAPPPTPAATNATRQRHGLGCAAG